MIQGIEEQGCAGQGPYQFVLIREFLPFEDITVSEVIQEGQEFDAIGSSQLSKTRNFTSIQGLFECRPA